jgi:Secretion system C-terminal sorting domain
VLDYYIYINIFDANYTRESNGGYEDDFRIRFSGTPLANGGHYEIDPDAIGVWYPIGNGDVVNIWNNWGPQFLEPNVDDFPSGYWESSIAVDVEDKAMILWGKEQSTHSIVKYRVYRALTLGTAPPVNIGDFTWVAETDNNTLYFKDKSVDNTDFIYYSHYFVESYDAAGVVKKSIIKSYLDPINTNWSKALMLTNNNNRPRIVWAPHPTMTNITYYKIYRSVTPYGGSPSRFYPYTLLATVDANTFEYTDYDFTMGGTSNTAHWQVKAYNGTESSPTNTVSTAVLYYDKNETTQEGLEIQASNTFKILGNSPNPFNAQTRIRFVLPELGEVSLKVYDIQGKVVWDQHGFKEQGLQSFLFDASDLSSGVYFYEIRTSKERAIKRLLLLK